MRVVAAQDTSRRLQRACRPRYGFTLIEILAALAVFAVIGVLANRILTGMIDINEGMRSQSDSLIAVQRALSIIERDVEQLTHRSVRDSLGDFLPPAVLGADTLLEFTRFGWQNPLAEPRTELQRVAYAYRDRKLYRLFWPVLDRTPDTEPVPQMLLADVQAVEFIAHDYQGDEHRYWPPALEADVANETAIAAIEMRLEIEPYGNLERLFLVTAPADLPSPKPSSETQLPVETEEPSEQRDD